MTRTACPCDAEAAQNNGAARRRDLAIAGSALGCLATAFVLSPAAAENGPVICPFRLMTGLPCPGCGLTRSWIALAHGDPGTAFARHAFGPLLFVLAIIAIAATVYSLARRREPVDLAARAGSRPAVALATVWCTVWLAGLLA